MPKKITQEEAANIIETRQPIGLFWSIEGYKGKTLYVGIVKNKSPFQGSI